MEVGELVGLAEWFESQVPSLRDAYQNLLAVLQHNASQSDKRPLEAELNRLEDAQLAMSFDELSLQQILVLERLGIRPYLGREGAAFIDETVRTANYDPATAVSRVQAVVTNIDNARNNLNAYERVIEQLKAGVAEPDQPADRIIIRVGFENDANIDNVVDWRDSSKEWYEIIRGLALAANESPEDTKVIGAATGSIILILAGTVAVTTMLATISKNISSVARDVIGVGVERENLRQKKLLTTAMEAELKKIEQKKRTDAVKTVMAELKKYLPVSALGDTKIALEASVKKLLDFNERGGVVDFVAPAEPEESDEGSRGEDKGRQLLADARRVIHEYQGERESLRLLTDQSTTANDNERD
ncbi:MAG TPA: hypothetical protein VFI80_04155 [Burkholderiales bacterium]|jgi:hypothetical protein|nr:hypothetical protein [Burkholderiales bacterium]